MEDFSWGNTIDSFTDLAGGYFGMRTAEAQASATGQAQNDLNNAVEQTTSAGQVPLSATQYQQVGAQVANSTPSESLPFGLTKNHLMIGGALLAAVLLIKR